MHCNEAVSGQPLQLYCSTHHHSYPQQRFDLLLEAALQKIQRRIALGTRSPDASVNFVKAAKLCLITACKTAHSGSLKAKTARSQRCSKAYCNALNGAVHVLERPTQSTRRFGVSETFIHIFLGV